MVKVYVAAVALFSVAAFLMFGWDKRQAKLERQRIPENSLHLISLLGGWPGSLLGQRVFRHKTRKLSFQITFWATVTIHVLVAFAIWYATRSS